VSNNQLQEQMKEVVWQLIEKYYNVDRACPQILTAKQILIGLNPIDNIGEHIANAVEKLIAANLELASASEPMESKPEDEEDTFEEEEEEDKETYIPDPFGYYYGGD